MVESEVRIVYGFDFDEALFAPQIEAARLVQDPDQTPYSFDKFKEQLKQGVACRLALRPDEFQLLGVFEDPLVVGYEILKAGPCGGQKEEECDIRSEQLVVPISEVLEKAKPNMAEWERRLRGAIERLYGQTERKPKIELKLLVWHAH